MIARSDTLDVKFEVVVCHPSELEDALVAFQPATLSPSSCLLSVIQY